MIITNRVLKIILFRGNGRRSDSEVHVTSIEAGQELIERYKKSYSQCIKDGTLEESAEVIFKIVETYTETWNC